MKKLPQGYNQFSVPKDYKGEVFLESQMRAFADPSEDAVPHPVEKSDEAPVGITREELVELASEQYGTDEINVDSSAELSIGNGDGCFVAAWVWVKYPNRFAITCETMCSGLTAAEGDLYVTEEEADAELLDLRTERDKSRAEEGEEPEGELDDFCVMEVRLVDGKWNTVDDEEEVTIVGEEG